jgi:hypothetical protein
MLEAFIGEKKLNHLRLLLEKDVETEQSLSEQNLLLSSETFDHFQNGRLSMKAMFMHDPGESVNLPY